MTVTTSRQHRKDQERERKREAGTHTDCDHCEQFISEYEWVRDEEGFRFCDEDCKRFFREERGVQK